MFWSKNTKTDPPLNVLALPEFKLETNDRELLKFDLT